MTTQQRAVLHQAQVRGVAAVMGLVSVMCLALQKDVETELRENDAEQERLLGSSLVYGESIQVSPLSSLSPFTPLLPCTLIPPTTLLPSAATHSHWEVCDC